MWLILQFGDGQSEAAVIAIVFVMVGYRDETLVGSDFDKNLYVNIEVAITWT